MTMYTHCLQPFPAVWLTGQISDTCKVSFLISRLVVCSETVFFFPSLKLQTHIDVRRLLYPFVQSIGIQNPGDWSLVSYSSLLHPVWNNRISSFLNVLFTNLEWIRLVKISFVTSKYFSQFMRLQHFFHMRKAHAQKSLRKCVLPTESSLLTHTTYKRR